MKLKLIHFIAILIPILLVVLQIRIEKQPNFFFKQTTSALFHQQRLKQHQLHQFNTLVGSSSNQLQRLQQRTTHGLAREESTPLLVPPYEYSFNVDDDDDGLDYYETSAYKLNFDQPILEYKRHLAQTNSTEAIQFEQPIVKQLWNEMTAGGPLTWFLLEEVLEPIDPSANEDDESQGEYAGSQYVLKKLMLGHGGYPEFIRHVNDPLKTTFGLLRLPYYLNDKKNPQQQQQGSNNTINQEQPKYIVVLVHWQGSDVSAEELKRSKEIVTPRITDYFDNHLSISNTLLTASNVDELSIDAVKKHIAQNIESNDAELKQRMIDNLVFE